MGLCSLIWSYSISDTFACAFLYCLFILLVCATAIYFYSRTRFNSPSRSYFFLNISTFSGHLLSRILLFSDITDISLWIFSSASFYLILVLFSSAVIALFYPHSFWTLETSMLFSEETAFASTCNSATPLLIIFSSSIRQAIYFFCW